MVAVEFFSSERPSQDVLINVMRNKNTYSASPVIPDPEYGNMVVTFDNPPTSDDVDFLASLDVEVTKVIPFTARKRIYSRQVCERYSVLARAPKASDGSFRSYDVSRRQRRRKFVCLQVDGLEFQREDDRLYHDAVRDHDTHEFNLACSKCLDAELKIEQDNADRIRAAIAARGSSS